MGPGVGDPGPCRGFQVKNLLIDVETSPHQVYSFSLWNANISNEKIIEPSRMISFAAKWRGSKKVEFYSVFHHGREAMVQANFELLSEADVITTYNGKKFDKKKWNTEFSLLGLGQPAPYKHIDLYQTVKEQFSHASNKLEWALNVYGLGGKVKHEGFELWIKCLQGDPKAWAKMRRYNKGDVTKLEALLDRLGPWVKGLPNAALYVEGDAFMCPGCGQPDKLVREGYALLETGKYQRYHCSGCGVWSRDTRRVSGVEIRSVAS